MLAVLGFAKLHLDFSSVIEPAAYGIKAFLRVGITAALGLFEEGIDWEKEAASAYRRPVLPVIGGSYGKIDV